MIIAATERELCGHEGLVCGVGPVEAAVATASALTDRRPDAVLHIGVAGARGLSPGILVIGTESVYWDLAAAIPVVAHVTPDPHVVAACHLVLAGARLGPIGTSAAVGAHRRGATDDVRVEAMEGFGVLRAAELLGIPAVEVRAVSNEIGENDRTKWQIETALEALALAVPPLVAAITGCDRVS